jgi:hypothetical protein
MIRLRATLLLFFSISLLTFNKSSGQDKLSALQFNKDARHYVDLLKKYYSGLYHYESEEQFNKRYENLQISSGDSITILDAYKRLAQFNAGLQDLHIAVGLPKGYFDKETKVLPFIFRRFGSQFYVSYNQSSDSTLVRGTRILGINGKSPVDEVESFKTLLGADFRNEYSKNYYSHNAFSAYYNRWYGKTDSVLIQYQKLNDSTISTEYLPFLLPKETGENFNKRYKNSTRKNFDLVTVDSVSNTSKLDILSFRGGKSLFAPGETKFKRKLRSTFRQIESDSVQNLILDLRGNGGGAVINVQRLISYLVSEPYRIYDTISISKAGFKKAVKPHFLFTALAGRIYFNKKSETGYYRDYVSGKHKCKPSKHHNFKGDLYVLMDGGSYSATAFTISLLKNMNRGVFVGTQPGGANWGSFAGVFHNTKLPNSKIQVRIPLMTLKHSSEGKTTNDFFVQPDYWVGQSFEDFLNKIDTNVEFIKMLVQNERN